METDTSKQVTKEVSQATATKKPTPVELAVLRKKQMAAQKAIAPQKSRFDAIKNFFKRTRTDKARIHIERDWAVLLVLEAVVLVLVFGWGVRLYYTVSNGEFFTSETEAVSTQTEGVDVELLEKIEERIEAQDTRQGTLLTPPSVVDPSL